MIDRRTFMGSVTIPATLFCVLSLAPIACAWAQQPAKLPKVAILSSRAPTAQACGANMQGTSLPCFLDAMRELGYPGRKQVSEWASKQRLPVVSTNARVAADGGLLSFGTDLTALNRRAAAYVDKVLKGAKPADLPVERPSVFILSVNVKTAKALGLTIPPSLLLRADEVIQ